MFDKKFVAIFLSIGVFSGVMSSSILTVISSEIVALFRIDYSDLQLRHVLFFSFFSCGLLFFGKYSDQTDPRRMFFSGLFLFMVGCVTSVVGISLNSWYAFVAGNIAQAIADSILVSSLMVLLRNNYSEDRLGWAFGVFAGALAAASVLGPLFGSFFSASGIIPLVYAVLFLMATISFVLLKNTQMTSLIANKHYKHIKVDFLVALLVFAIIFSIQLSFLTSNYIYLPIITILTISISCVIYHNFKGKGYDSFLPDGIAKNYTFIIIAARAFILSGMANLVFFIMPIYMREYFDISATEVGIILAIESLLPLVFSVYAGKLADRWNRMPLYLANIIGVIGITYLATLDDGVTMTSFLLFFALIGAGATLSSPAQNLVIAKSCSINNMGQFMGFFHFIIFCASGFGIAYFTGATSFKDELNETSFNTLLIYIGVIQVSALALLILESLMHARAVKNRESLVMISSSDL